MKKARVFAEFHPVQLLQENYLKIREDLLMLHF